MTKSEYYAAAVRRLDEYRNAALEHQAANIDKAYKKVPGLVKLDAALKKNMRDFMEASLDHVLTDEEADAFKNRSLNLQAERAEKLYEKCGLTPSDLEPKFHCKDCGDEGFVNGKMCRCLKKLLAEEYMKNSNLAGSYRSRTFKNVDCSLYGSENEEMMKSLSDYCHRYVSDFAVNKQSLYFYGIPGCGKTFMTTLIGTELINSGYLVFYSPVQDMISSFEAEKFDKKLANTVDTDIFNSCELLIIDDLGTEFSTPFAESVIYNVINTRINKNLPTLISSNFDPDDFKEVYNDRLISRLKYEFTIVQFPNVDIRERKKNSKK